MRPTRVQTKGLGLFFMIAGTFSCGSQPVQPESVDGTERVIALASDPRLTNQPPEEEILGRVFRNGISIGPDEVGYSVTLEAFLETGACIFGIDASGQPTSCKQFQSMPVMPGGSTKRSDRSIHWGWFDTFDSDGNPCNPIEREKGVTLLEWHDLDNDGTFNEPGNEQHCFTPGTYRVTLTSGPVGGGSVSPSAVSLSRTVDYFPVTGMVGGRHIENWDADSAADLFVHFDVEAAFDYVISTNKLKIDNPLTGTGFDAGTVTVGAGIDLLFMSPATVAWTGGPPGALLYQVYFDVVNLRTNRTNYANSDRHIRSSSYQQAGTYQTMAEVLVPNASGEADGAFSPLRTIVAEGTVVAVNSVQVSPTSVSIPTGGTWVFTATPRAENGDPVPNKTVVWSSSNSEVASIAHSGNSATVTGISPGTATIEARVDGVVGTASVTVTTQSGTICTDYEIFDEAAVAGRTIYFRWCPYIDIILYQHQWLFGDGNKTIWLDQVEVPYAYSTPGTYTARLRVRPKSNTTDITTRDVTITVSGESYTPQVNSVTVNPVTTSVIETGEQAQFVAQVLDQQGARMFDKESQLTWYSSNPAVATLNSTSGSVVSAVGQAAGTTTITASVDGFSASAGLTVTEPPPPVDAATPVGNSFPTQMSLGQFYAVSATFYNAGTTTWSSSGGYSLTQLTPGDDYFAPLGVAFSTWAAPGDQASVPFNLVNQAPVGSYWVEYAMHRYGGLIGQGTGRTVNVTSDPCVKYCTLALHYADGTTPGGADGTGNGLLPNSDGDVVQRLEVRDYRLRFVEGEGTRARIQYYGALAEPWAVDVTFRIEAPPGTVVPGLARKNVLIQGYEVVVEPGGPGVTLVHLRRVTPDAALPAGELLLLDVPLSAPAARTLPERLTRVEVTATR